MAPDQYGASAHRVGARAMAAAHVLHYGVGIPVRKVASVLRVLTGVKLTQSTITQACPERSRSAAMQATFRPCSPSGIAHPRITSSTSASSSPGVLSISFWTRHF